jgi:hypothetical protein
MLLILDEGIRKITTNSTTPAGTARNDIMNEYIIYAEILELMQGRKQKGCCC